MLDGVESARVRFDADRTGEWTADVTSWWVADDADVAVLTIADTGRPVRPAGFGRAGDGYAVLAVRAVGFPLWKLKKRADGRTYRDMHDAIGSVAVLSNRREGTFEVTVPAPERDPDPQRSPWEGMSGAALWAGDRIVGVISLHHRRDGLGRLAAVRLDRVLASNGALRDLLDVRGLLPDVAAPADSRLGWTAYHRQVVDIAPTALLDRDRELARLTEFCAGQESYAWWEAGPWAGKTALMSWFVLHPPAGVEVVSFFVTGRLAGQADSDAYLDALLEQLTALADQPRAKDISDRYRRLGELLDSAAKACRQHGRRVVLVVDGLDEDAGPAAGKPSIASLLPSRPPPGVHVIVASRPDPPIPDDVRGDHPLRECRPHRLDVSEHAQHIELNATYELNRLLAGTVTQQETLGFITASGGGLSATDLHQLSGQPPYVIDQLLGGVFGRTVGARASSVPGRDGRSYLFTHETLRTVSQQKFGAGAESFRRRIILWAHGFRDRGWPQDTPSYLLSGYLRMLVEHGEAPEVVALASDRARHRRMLGLSGGAGLVDLELRTAGDVAVRRTDLAALLLLSSRQDEVRRGDTDAIAQQTSSVWAMLGEVERAEALARNAGPRAIHDTVIVLGTVGRYDRALVLLALVDDESVRRHLLSRLVGAAARRKDHQGVRTLLADTTIGDVPEAHLRASLFAALAAASPNPFQARELLARAGADAAAVGASYRRGAAYSRARAFARVAEAAFAVGAFEQVPALLAEADTLTHGGSRLDWRARTLGHVATAYATVGELARAGALLAEAQAMCDHIGRIDQCAHALAEIAECAIDIGDGDRTVALLTAAEALAPNMPHAWLATVAARLAAAAARTLPVRARSLLIDAEQAARAITGPHVEWRHGSNHVRAALTAVAGATAAIGDRAGAEDLLAELERMADVSGNPLLRDAKLAVLARAAAIAGEPDHAVTLLDRITEPDRWIEAAIATATAAPRWVATLLSAAHTRASSIDAPHRRIRLLSTVGLAAETAGVDVPSLAEVEAATATDPTLWVEFVKVVIDAGDLDRAEALVVAAPESAVRDQLAGLVAHALAGARHYVRAVALSPDAAPVRWRAPALAAAGEHAAAESLVDEVDVSHDQAVTLIEMAIVATDNVQARAWLAAADERELDWKRRNETELRLAEAWLLLGDENRAFARDVESPSVEGTGARIIGNLAAARDYAGLVVLHSVLGEYDALARALVDHGDWAATEAAKPVVDFLTTNLMLLDWSYAVLFVATVDPTALLAVLPQLIAHTETV